MVEIPHDSHGQHVSGFTGIFPSCTVALVVYAQRHIQQNMRCSWCMYV